ncbi:SAP18 [Phaffia rhodozyma]|uniref:SAP18 n=1 Tax=Phaffia rhodozyma TaxID=264483 RepID=A0A0F7SLZ9_PHARH|nr:SAP18 [Phaffia rhodozyma]
MQVDSNEQDASEPRTPPRDSPFLIRTFVHPQSFHPVRLFEDRKIPVRDEYQLYAFENTSFGELLEMLVLNLPEKLKPSTAKYALRMIWPDNKLRRFSSKDLQTISLRALRERDSSLDRTLQGANFVPGSYLLVSVVNPDLASGSSAHPGPGPGPGLASRPPPPHLATSARPGQGQVPSREFANHHPERDSNSGGAWTRGSIRGAAARFGPRPGSGRGDHGPGGPASTNGWGARGGRGGGRGTGNGNGGGREFGNGWTDRNRRRESPPPRSESGWGNRGRDVDKPRDDDRQRSPPRPGRRASPSYEAWN